jgi:hypothetical protein
MKRILLSAALMASAASACAASNVGVSITIGQPGFYGSIDIGDAPRPVTVYERPIVIRPVPVGVVREPIYLRVPPGHERHWKRYCAQYRACDRPVYFVQDRWYREEFMPHYREQHRDHGAYRPDDRRDGPHGAPERREDRRDDRRDDRRGPGESRGPHGEGRDRH